MVSALRRSLAWVVFVVTLGLLGAAAFVLWQAAQGPGVESSAAPAIRERGAPAAAMPVEEFDAADHRALDAELERHAR